MPPSSFATPYCAGSRFTPASTIDLGLGHHYRLDEPLAHSTCGDIWAATWLQTGTAVAVKVLPDRPFASRPVYGLALHREGEHLRRLSHRHIVRCQKLGSWQGEPVLVLERLPVSLKAMLASAAQSTGALATESQPPRQQAKTVDEPQALAWTRQVARALLALHRSGRRHLDLKPANLLCTAAGASGHRVLKLADFGACLLTDGAPHPFVGTPGWAAPEQCTPVGSNAAGQPLFATSAASDWYALGELLHRLLTGRLSTDGAQRLRRYRAGGLAALLHGPANAHAAVSCGHAPATSDEQATWLPGALRAIDQAVAGNDTAPVPTQPATVDRWRREALEVPSVASDGPWRPRTLALMALLLDNEPPARIEGAHMLLDGQDHQCGLR